MRLTLLFLAVIYVSITCVRSVPLVFNSAETSGKSTIFHRYRFHFSSCRYVPLLSIMGMYGHLWRSITITDLQSSKGQMLYKR